MRTFIALDLPEEARLALAAASGILRGSWPALSWVREGSWHLTLAFLGEQGEAGVACARSAMDGLGNAGAPRLVESRIGRFPGRGPWRVLVFELEAQGRLQALYRDLNRGLAAEARRAGLPPLNAEWSEDPGNPGRPFRPHLTLARRPQGRPSPGQLDPRRLDEAASIFRSKMPAGGWPLGPLLLYKSELRRDGALYTEIYRKELMPS